MAKNLSSSINALNHSLEEATESNGLRLPISSFDRHIQFNVEYEIDLSRTYGLVFAIEYDKERVSNSTSDVPNQIFQGINYELLNYVVSVSAIRYFPVFNVDLGKAKLFTGAGLEVLYANANMSFQFDNRPLLLQVVRFTKVGYGYGARIFGGLEIPFIPSVYLQLRLGFSIRNDSNLTGKTKTNRPDPIDPNVFEFVNDYNFSSFWFNLGLAYYF